MIGSRRMPSKSLGEDGNKYLRSNVAHLLALVSDVLVEMNGGLKQLLAKAANPVLSDRIRVSFPCPPPSLPYSPFLPLKYLLFYTFFPSSSFFCFH